MKSQSPVPPSRWQPSAPRDLEAICLKCLEKKATNRYPSAEALAEDLERWLRGEPTVVRPARWLGKLWHTARRHPARSAVSLSTCFVLLIAFAAFCFLHRANEDLDQPVREIQGKLAAGQSVVLVEPSGAPRWYRWRTGASGAQVSAAADGAFAVHSWTLSLLELLPDPQCQRYRFRAEVRHEKSDNYGEVGIYCLFNKHPTHLGDVDCFCQLAFNDIRDPRNELPPGLGGLRPLGPGNMANFQPRIYREPGLIGDQRLGGLSSQAFTPAGFGGGDWHRLEVKITPEWIEASWDQQAMRGQLKRDAMEKDLEEQIANPKLGLDREAFEPPAALGPRGALGLYVLQGSASFRNVVVEPDDNQE